jgi:hypothetical protein
MPPVSKIDISIKEKGNNGKDFGKGTTLPGLRLSHWSRCLQEK